MFEDFEAETSFAFELETVNGSFSGVLSLSCARVDTLPLFLWVRAVRVIFESSSMTFMGYAQFDHMIFGMICYFVALVSDLFVSNFDGYAFWFFENDGFILLGNDISSQLRRKEYRLIYKKQY